MNSSSWHRGFCAYTDAQPVSAAKDCGTPGVVKGAWRLARAGQCVRRCEACDACVYVSFDPADRDCSWFTTCEVSRLKSLRSNWHHTLVVRRGAAIVTPRPLPQLPPFPPNLPEDGTQGYSPYFYKMDEPVRVRRTTSYGRGWQLLRSRGAGNEDDGPCDPPQRADTCSCSEEGSSVRSGGSTGGSTGGTDGPMPRCVASAACGGGGGGGGSGSGTGGRSGAGAGTGVGAGAAQAGGGTALVLVLDANKRELRFSFGGSLAKGYAFQLRYVVRLALSLRRVNNSLPVRLLASGERNLAAEAALQPLGVLALPPDAAPPPRAAPAWASKWALGSFGKLRALALTRFDRLVLLDNDALVLRNIDHLPALALPTLGPAPPPAAAAAAAAAAAEAVPQAAMVFGYKCYPRRELRGATIVLRPSAAAWARAQVLMDDGATGVYDDLGEGSVWRRLYPAVTELPVGYSSLRTSDLTAHEWAEVSVLHDPHLMHDFHRAGYAAATAGLVRALDAQADALMRDTFNALVTPPRGARRAAGKRRGRRRGRN